MSRNQFSFRFIVMTITVVLAALLGSLLLAPSAYAYDSEELAFLTLINNHRAQNGLPALTMSYMLFNASEAHSYDMGARSYFAHNTPEGVTPWDRIRAAGYTYNTWLGENIAAGYETAQTVFDGWRNSPAHNANMLSPNFQAIGVSRYYVSGSQYGWYWTTDFGGVVDLSRAYDIDAAFVDKYSALGGAPGAAMGNAQAVTGGMYQDFSNGRLYKNDATSGTYWVHGAILGKYIATGGSQTFGLPTSDETTVDGGNAGARMNTFTGGNIYWSSATSAHIVYGDILAYYTATIVRAYGLPATDSYSIPRVPGAWECDLQYANIYSSSTTGIHEVHGTILWKYLLSGGPQGYGLPTSDETAVPGAAGANATAARMNTFTAGNIYWSPWTSAHLVFGAILNKYPSYVGALGMPATDVYGIYVPGVPGAQQCLLQGGRVYTDGTNAYEVQGLILSKYLAMGGPQAWGLPTSDETPVTVQNAPGARWNDFQAISIYWSPATSVHEVHGDIRLSYRAAGDAPALGLPITDEIGVPGYPSGRKTECQWTTVYWSGIRGANAVQGEIRGKYLALGGPARFGLPTSNEQDATQAGTTRRWSPFEGANIYWSVATGAHEVHGAIRDKYVAPLPVPGGAGGPTGTLGLPTTDEYYAGGSSYRNDFEHGNIIWTAAGGAVIH